MTLLGSVQTTSLLVVLIVSASETEHRGSWSGQTGEEEAHEADRNGAAGGGQDGGDEHGGIDFFQLHMTHGQQHQDGAAVGHGVKGGGGENGNTVDDVHTQPHLHEPRGDDGKGDELTGRGTAGEHTHDGHNDSADEDGGGLHAGQCIQNGLECVRVCDDGGKTADGAYIQGHGDRVYRSLADNMLDVFGL